MWTGLCFVSVTSRRQERTNDVPNQIADRSIPMNRMINIKNYELNMILHFVPVFIGSPLFQSYAIRYPPFGFGKKTNRKIMKGNNKRVGMKNKTKTE